MQSSLWVHVGLDDTEPVAASLNLYARRSRKIGADQIHQAGTFAAQLAAAMKSVEAYEAAARNIKVRDVARRLVEERTRGTTG